MTTHAFRKATRISALGVALALVTTGAFAAQGITMEQATRIALSRVPNGVVEEVEQDTWRGQPVYEVEVRAPDGCEHEFEISINDGAVLASNVDCD